MSETEEIMSACSLCPRDCHVDRNAGKKGFCSLFIEKSMMNSEIGFGRKVLQVLEKEGISFEHLPSGIDTMTLFIHQDEFAEKEQQVISGQSGLYGIRI